METKVSEYARALVANPTTAFLVALGASFALSAAWVVNDYHAWVSFGTGGTPPNWAGYQKMTKFRLLCAWSGDDLRDPAPLDAEGPSFLGVKLPQRSGQRPKIVSRTMPQRQHPAPLDEQIRKRVHGLPKKYQEELPHLLTLNLSLTEGKSTDAIYALPDLPSRHASAKDRILGNEIAHVHPAENSLHVWLSEPDARAVVDAGWGERFPLSSLGMCHQGWTFVYAPRTMEDVDVIEEIVKAAIGYLTGGKP